MKELIPGYHEGADISLINVMYIPPQKQEDGKWSKDTAQFIFYDFEKEEVKVYEKHEVPYEFYTVKPEIEVTRPQFFMSRNDVLPIECKYRELNKKVAEMTDQMDVFRANIQNGNYKENSKLHYHPRVLQSDMHIEDKLRNIFDRMYTNRPLEKVTKAFFDIEYNGKYLDNADTIDHEGRCPINALSLINEIDKRVYVFLLREQDNPLIPEFERYVKSGQVYKDIKEFVKKAVGGWKNEIRYGLDKYNYVFNFYNDEIVLLQEFFTVINYFKPTFVEAWNGSDFDFRYICNRIKQLGHNPNDIICGKEFKTKFLKHYIDTGLDKDGKPKELAERGDFISVSTCSIWIDQMINFASRRKGQSKFIKYNLDYIGQAICDVRKLDYSHITNKIHELPYKDYKTFVFYNIVDTIVQFCIDKKTGDTDYIYTKAMMNNIRYHKAHRQTAYQTTRMAKDFYNYYEDGLILGNNVNSSNPKPNEKYPGAYVADPIKLSDAPKVKVNGKAINVVHNTVDFDYSAQYPNELRENNMAPHTQVGKIIIEELIFKNENPFKNKYYTRGGAFLEDYMSRNILVLCYRWFSLASYGELITDVMDYMKEKAQLNYFMTFNDNHKLNYYNRLSENTKAQYMKRLEENELLVYMVRDYIPDYSIREKINVDEVVFNNETRYQKLSVADKNARLKDDE